MNKNKSDLKWDLAIVTKFAVSIANKDAQNGTFEGASTLHVNILQ